MNGIIKIPTGKVNTIKIPRCHTIGTHISSKPCDKIINFSWHGIVVEVLKYNNLLPKVGFVSEDFPDVWIERCSKLRIIVTLANNMDKHKGEAGLSRDKLIWDGKAGDIKSHCDLPSDILLNESCEGQNHSILAFHGMHSTFSNFHLAEYVIENLWYKKWTLYLK